MPRGIPKSGINSAGRKKLMDINGYLDWLERVIVVKLNNNGPQDVKIIEGPKWPKTWVSIDILFSMDQFRACFGQPGIDMFKEWFFVSQGNQSSGLSRATFTTDWHKRDEILAWLEESGNINRVPQDQYSFVAGERARRARAGNSPSFKELLDERRRRYGSDADGKPKTPPSYDTRCNGRVMPLDKQVSTLKGIATALIAVRSKRKQPSSILISDLTPPKGNDMSTTDLTSKSTVKDTPMTPSITAKFYALINAVQTNTLTAEQQAYLSELLLEELNTQLETSSLMGR